MYNEQYIYIYWFIKKEKEKKQFVNYIFIKINDDDVKNLVFNRKKLRYKKGYVCIIFKCTEWRSTYRQIVYEIITKKKK